MKKIVVILCLLSSCASGTIPQTVYAQTATSAATTASTRSDAGASANTGAITFEASQPLRSLSTTSAVVTSPSMFGGSNNCGLSNTLGIGITGFGIGGSRASESDSCNSREDAALAYRLGRKDVAEIRFFCFGEDRNKLAWESLGNRCPTIKKKPEMIIDFYK